MTKKFRWTPERDAVLRTRRADGWARARIAASLGCTVEQVRHRVSYLGLFRIERSSWNEDRVTRLTDLWAAGLTASEIGLCLGISRDAVIGKAHRLGLPGRGAAEDSFPPLESLQPLTGHAQDAVQPSGCQWPFGDPGEPGFRFCGAKRHGHRSYCPEHRAKAYVKAPRRGAVEPDYRGPWRR